jgi:hypothetical protein
MARPDDNDRVWEFVKALKVDWDLGESEIEGISA